MARRRTFLVWATGYEPREIKAGDHEEAALKYLNTKTPKLQDGGFVVVRMATPDGFWEERFTVRPAKRRG